MSHLITFFEAKRSHREFYSPDIGDLAVGQSVDPILCNCERH